MEDYSERQLLLLSNFVYLPCSVSDENLETILDSCRDDSGGFSQESVRAAGIGGGMSDEDVCTLFKEFDKEIEKNPDFGHISAARKLNDGKVRAICYTDKKNENPIVVFRGTGGSKEAWSDNFEGGYENDTSMQKLASDFVENECGAFSNITVTGHSKGGNLSQYVTVSCGQTVKKCVSFDGQGFNEAFIEDNKGKIANAAPKIKSVAAYNDFVNILLTPIAGQIMYVENEDSIVAAHSSLAMLVNNTFDENGNIVSHKDQSLSMSILKKTTDKLVSKVDEMGYKDKQAFSAITGSTIATALNIKSLKDGTDTATSLLGAISSVFLAKIIEKNDAELSISDKLVTNYLYVDTDSLNTVANSLLDVSRNMRVYKERLNEIENNMAINSATGILTRKKLEDIMIKIEKLDYNLTNISALLELVAHSYEEKEEELLSIISV